MYKRNLVHPLFSEKKGSHADNASYPVQAHVQRVSSSKTSSHTQISRNTMDVMRRNCQNQASKWLKYLIQPAIIVTEKSNQLFFL